MATIRKRKGKYEAQIRRTGLPHVSKSFHTLTDARTWARHMEARADRGDLPADPRALAGVTLGDLVRRYRDSVSPQKRDCVSERYILTAFLSHPICCKPLSGVRTEDFAAYRDERLQEIKPASLKRQLAPIHHLFEIARDEWGLPIRDNPLAKLQLKAVDQRRERRLRPGEEERIVADAVRRKNPLVVAIIRLALETAMRRGEILATRRNHVNFEDRTLLIPKSKNGHARTIPLSDAALAILRQRIGSSADLLFPVTANAFRLAWERLKRRVKLDDLRFHDLRHEAISRFFERGLSLPEVALISGHRDARMLLRYAHANKQIVLLKINSAPALNLSNVSPPSTKAFVED